MQRVLQRVQQPCDDAIAELTMIIAWGERVLALQPRVPHPIAGFLEAMTEGMTGSR